MHRSSSTESEPTTTPSGPPSSNSERDTGSPVVPSAAHDAFRVALTDALRSLADPMDVQAEAARVLGEHLGVSRAFYAESDAEAEHVTFEQDYVCGVPSVAGRYRLDQFGVELMDRIRAGQTLAVTDVYDPAVTPKIGEAERRAYTALGLRAYLVVPLVKKGKLVAFLALHQAEPRAWTSSEIALVEETAERTWSAVERARSEEQLRRSEEKYRLLFDSIDQGFCTVEVVFDDDGRPIDYVFLEVNGAFERQTGLVDAAGKAMRSLRPAHEAHWFETYGHIARTGEPARFEAYAAEIGRWYSVYAFRIGEPEARRVAILFEDITLRKQSETALREADRRKDEFLATLAHELRNPLAPIRTGLELMRLVRADPERVDDLLVKMENQTRQLMRLVDDLLDVSRISSGKFRLRTERIELAPIVQSALDATRSDIERARHELVVELPPEPIPLRADPTRLTQVLSNLLTNAAKYTPAGGRIALTAEREGKEVVISVRDTGIGIPGDMLERVFEMFAQIERSEERTQTGLGIGLMLVKRLVEMHGGSVVARSDGPGQGSEFCLRLPILRSTAPRTPLRQAEAETAAAPARLSVLIADDNRDAAEMLGGVVELLGHEVHLAYDGLEAIDAADRQRPDAILMDLGMPRLSGFDAARRIREQPWARDMVLIALTGWGQKRDRQRTKDVGFDHHLVKPVGVDQLQELLNRIRREGGA